MNRPIYAVDTDFGSCILQIDDSQQTPVQLTNPTCQQPKEVTTSVWNMYFEWDRTQNSVGVGVVLISSSKENIHLSYKLNFKTTNNIAEYEALLLGVKSAKEMGIMCMKIFGDAYLII